MPNLGRTARIVQRPGDRFAVWATKYVLWATIYSVIMHF